MKRQIALTELEKALSEWTRTPVGRRAFLSSLPVLLASCASGSKHRYREGDNTGQGTSLSVKDERAMTAEYQPQMEKEYPKLKNSYAQGYISALGKSIVTANGLEGQPYHYSFQVVDSKMVNAFALPAGPIYVTAPLIKLAKSEAELAGVIGHEVGHIRARHTAERIDAAKKAESKSLLYGIGGALLGGAAGYGLGKLLCRKEDKECLKRATLYGGMAGGAGGLLIQKFAFMANSREDEMEADRIGFKAAMNSGYHPHHVGKFYERLLEMEEQHKRGGTILAPFADALSTHPPGKERVAQQHQMASQHGGAGKVSSSEFTRLQRLL